MLRTFLMILVPSLAACPAVAPPIEAQPEKPAYTLPGLESDHPCVLRGSSDGWKEAQGLECADGYADGYADGFDAGRLVCLFQEPYCPECVGDGSGSWSDEYRAGYLEGFRVTYDEGWLDSGCDPVQP
jgi:hypothetical protein